MPRITNEVRAAIKASSQASDHSLLNTVLLVTEQRTSGQVLDVLNSLPIEKHSAWISTDAGVQELRTYSYRGRPIVRVHGTPIATRSINSGHLEAVPKVSGLTRGNVQSIVGKEHHSGASEPMESPANMLPIEFPEDALEEVSYDHPQAVSSAQLEQALVAMIALETGLSQMLEAESQAQADFEAWLGTQIGTGNPPLQSIFKHSSFGVANTLAEDCISQGLQATSTLVMSIGGAVASQTALNGYLAAGTGATLKGIGLSLLTYSTYIGAAVAAYAVYKAAECRFNRGNGGPGSQVALPYDFELSGILRCSVAA
ncbi:hypothetical protein [Gemmatimonas sp.]|uniref:hypothetical protein n=1 Tax=Gemmatimonas sp. TaxID=1962908 RepID=UPI003DA32813